MDKERRTGVINIVLGVILLTGSVIGVVAGAALCGVIAFGLIGLVLALGGLAQARARE